MKKLLISACLLGHKVRYDGNHNLQMHARLQVLINAGHVVSICPEIAGGLPTPRAPAEIQKGNSAYDVLKSQAEIVTVSGEEVTTQYVSGAKKSACFSTRTQYSGSHFKSTKSVLWFRTSL